MGQLFLIVIDAYSKWIEVYPTSSTSATATIEKLRQAFANYGLPEMLSQIMVRDLPVKNLQILWPGMEFYM